jgi:hypothetical protein
MVVILTVFENILHKLDDKQTVTFSILGKQHKISFFLGLLAITEHPLNLA